MPDWLNSVFSCQLGTTRSWGASLAPQCSVKPIIFVLSERKQAPQDCVVPGTTSPCGTGIQYEILRPGGTSRWQGEKRKLYLALRLEVIFTFGFAGAGLFLKKIIFNFELLCTNESFLKVRKSCFDGKKGIIMELPVQTF